MAIRILIADDHNLLRAGLRSLMTVDEELVVVGEATTGGEAVEAAQILHPDIVLMDIGMPGNEELEATREVLQVSPHVRVLMMTMHEDTVLVQECLRMGVSGYIVKRAAESELIDAIHSVQKGQIYVHPTLIKSLVEPPHLPEEGTYKEVEPLTSREMEILKFIAQGHTNREVADALCISVRTVETHRGNLMEKLNIHSRAELVRYAYDKKMLEGI